MAWSKSEWASKDRKESGRHHRAVDQEAAVADQEAPDGLKCAMPGCNTPYAMVKLCTPDMDIAPVPLCAPCRIDPLRMER